MITNIPFDLKAETLVSYLQHHNTKVNFMGTHKRNVYEDVLSVDYEEDEYNISLARNGLYDILPEALFHPIDRFENIPANEYKERFAEECELQQREETDARKFFVTFDKFIFDLSCEFNRIKDEFYNDNSVLTDIIGDNLSEEFRNNRFIKKLIPFLSVCCKIRGNKDLITLILRQILKDEGILLSVKNNSNLYKDSNPLYNSSIDDLIYQNEDYYLGSEYYESVTEYELSYWNNNECNESFLSFVSDIKIFEDFINNYFIGIESSVRFLIGTITLPVRLSDELCHNYLEYNTNL